MDVGRFKEADNLEARRSELSELVQQRLQSSRKVTLKRLLEGAGIIVFSEEEQKLWEAIDSNLDTDDQGVHDSLVEQLIENLNTQIGLYESILKELIPESAEDN